MGLSREHHYIVHKIQAIFNRAINIEPIFGGHECSDYVADKFLYEKYNYQVGPFYPNNSWMYDWYITKLDLYIELDGGCRPERTKEKIVINKQLDRECLVIKTKDIYDKHKLDEFM